MVLPLSGRLHAWGRLLRVSLFATAAADPVVGAFLGSGGAPPARALLAPLASLCVYHGAMALNDLVDRRLDAERGRSRPLVDGSLQPGAAAVAVALLLAAGLGLAFVAGGTAGLAWLGAAAATAVVYDLVGRGPVRGPFLLALARATNLLFGAACAGWSVGSGNHVPLVAAAGYAGYVLLVSRLGRMEDGDAGEELGHGPSTILAWLASVLFLAPLATGLMAWLRMPMSLDLDLLVAVVGVALGLKLLADAARPLRAARKDEPWTPPQVEGVMGLALSRFLPLTVGCLLLATATPAALVAAGVLLLFGRAGRRLMAVFPPS